MHTADGTKESLEFIKRNLFVNLQYEQEESQNLRDGSAKAGSAARLARKQFKETAEIILGLNDELDKRSEKKS